jgi:two-component system KDP operon response regulator KdpE
MQGESKILIVDVEPQITRALRTSLGANGYAVQIANDGDFGLSIFEDWNPDLVITDLSIPNMMGVELCGHIRDRSEVPIIILSVKGDERSKIEALDKGADDYIVKPFSINELLARVRAHLRRVKAANEPQLTEPVRAGDFQVDFEARIVLVTGRRIRLTPKEFDLLVYIGAASRKGPNPSNAAQRRLGRAKSSTTRVPTSICESAST